MTTYSNPTRTSARKVTAGKYITVPGLILLPVLVEAATVADMVEVQVIDLTVWMEPSTEAPRMAGLLLDPDTEVVTYDAI